MEYTRENQTNSTLDTIINDTFSIAIVGVGPNGTYAMGRLAAEFSAVPPTMPIKIHVIEKSGEFGAGWVHSPSQPHSSMLNRIVGQIAFECDESNSSARHLLPKSLRPTFHQWCQEKYRKTHDPRFNLAPEDWPQRYIHGQALVDVFKKYVDVLRDVPLVSVELHHAEATGVREQNSSYLVSMAKEGRPSSVSADHILFTTGHSKNKPKHGSYEERMIRFSHGGEFNYSPFAYPLEKNVKAEVTTNNHVVGCVGLGLTAIDVFLYLTEGRGGRFVSDGNNGRLKYLKSGREPKKIVGISRSGVFTAARAFNSKQVDLDRFQHQGLYLNPNTVDKLRDSLGSIVSDHYENGVRQLDFERHLFPIVYLEMATLYYKVLFGVPLFRKIASAVEHKFSRFVQGTAGVYDIYESGVAYFEQEYEPIISSAIESIEQFIAGSLNLNAELSQELGPIFSAYFSTVFGNKHKRKIDDWISANEFAALRDWVLTASSKFSHSINPQDHRFNWQRMIQPIDPEQISDGSEFTQQILEYMDYDNLKGLQGNIFNPEKAACDGVWRDLRPVFAHAADYGGFTADSHVVFIKKYMRYHNRIANGTSVEIMEKMSALIRSGILDVSVGPQPEIKECRDEPCIKIVGALTNTEIKVDTLIDAKLHDLNIDLDEMPLYRNLLENGFINRWHYPSGTERAYVPGGIELSKEFHPIEKDGIENRNFTFLGPASEGVMFFQVGAARPFQNHHVLNDIIVWSEEVFEQISKKAVAAARRSDAMEYAT